MHVVGTAGHVDHGKTALVRALTGINPDRLREEHEREMSIDLGFAWVTLPDGREVGFVDVPGHRDFIDNMLAGIGGIDAALLVVAADEGIMPQTQEHVAILDLLEVDRCLAVLTKVDLVQEEGWVDLIAEEIDHLLASTSLAGAKIVSVSAKTGQGLPELQDELVRLLDDTPQRRDLGRPRLGVDRSFTMTGFGTIATGTLIDGELEVGDEVVVLPGGSRARIRGLQTHRTSRERAIPGSRVAVNLSGVDAEDIQRGDVIAHPDQDEPTTLLDVQVRVLQNAPGEIVHDQEVKLFLGSAQRMARVRILGAAAKLRSGERGWLQLLLADPLVARFGDHYILRRPSPPSTLAGGRVADPHPGQRHRKRDDQVLRRLQAKMEGTSEDRLLQALDQVRPLTLGQAMERVSLPAGEAEAIAGRLVEAGDLVELPGSERLLLSRSGWQELRERVASILKAYHRQNPLRAGIGQEELREKMGLAQRPFSAVLRRLADEEAVRNLGKEVADTEFEVALSPAQREKVEALLADYSEYPFTPPTATEARSRVGPDLYHLLIRNGGLTEVSDEIVFASDAFADMLERIGELISENGPQTVAQIRDHLGSTRKFVLPLLEELDRRGFTIREGDKRSLA